MKVILLIVALLCLVGTASATDYYVDANTGNDGDDGLSLGNAWLTLEYADGQLSAGDTLYLVDGTWNNQHFVFTASGTEGNPITVTAYNGTPILNGQDMSGTGGIGIDFGGQSYINISGFEILNYNYGIIQTGEDGVKGLITDRMEVHDIFFEGITYVNYVSDSEINNCIVYNIGNGDSGNSVGIYGTYGNTSNDMKHTHNITIDNLTVLPYYNHSALDLFGDLIDIKVFNSIFSGSQVFSHVTPGGSNLIEELNFSYNSVNNSTHYGVKISCNNSTFIGNTIYNNTQVGFALMTAGVNNTFQDNIIYNNLDWGLEIRSSTSTIDNNSVYNNPDYDYRCDQYSNYVIKNPLSLTNTFKIALDSAAAVLQFDDGTIFTENGAGEPRWYPDKSNYTVPGYTTYTIYDMTLTPIVGYGKGIVINTYMVNDVSNITVNISTPTTATMTFKVDNESNTYNFYVNDVWNTSEISDSDSIVSFDYEFPSSTPTNFEVTWNSTVGWSYNEDSIYQGKRFTVDDNGNFTQQDNPTQEDTNLTGLINVVIR